MVTDKRRETLLAVTAIAIEMLRSLRDLSGNLTLCLMSGERDTVVTTRKQNQGKSGKENKFDQRRHNEGRTSPIFETCFASVICTFI